MQFPYNKGYLDYNLFIKDYNIDKISSLKVQRKKKKSYLNFMIVFHLIFFCLNIVKFNWMLFFLYLSIYLTCFLVCDQYEYFVKFDYNNEVYIINIHPKEFESYAHLEQSLSSNKLIPIQFKNESFIKSYI
jgi:hypothetical protein